MKLLDFYNILFGNYSPIQKALVILAFSALILLYLSSPERGVEALESTGNTFTGVIILIFAGTLLGAVIELVIPQELIVSLLGEGSGMKGILIATFLGGLTPGGPYVVYPILASLYSEGMGIAPIISYIFAWSCIALGRVPFELAFFDSQIIMRRILLGIPLPIIAGILAELII
ncbi:hypothetical protein GF319_01345 [Candidatus Bathyarchaeota archaeon]|nr:hypothetical protein [Candidatus Bathyarchaeota archaeon]